MELKPSFVSVRSNRTKTKYSTVFTSGLSILLAGCGSKSYGTKKNDTNGFDNYIPPPANYNAPEEVDQNLEILNSAYIQPYWVAALEMDQYDAHITKIIEEFDRVVEFTFPLEQPDYDHESISGWLPASENMKSATREILTKLDEILNISFIEGTNPYAVNVIALAQSKQSKTSGFSYFPNNYYELGMDVFIAHDYSSPIWVNEQLTNYDYEVLIHELGHSLGLKHPFAVFEDKRKVLSPFEDNNKNTVMSYDHKVDTFDGTLRSLDWMALTKFYGVKPTYNAGDDTYNFSATRGTFIIDGAGNDTIIAVDAELDVIVDLRPGAHSYLGSKSSYITSSNQLTISYGSDIENVETGAGDDKVIGTELDNLITTGSGDDIIIAGGGADVIQSGTGSDRIDLFEAVQAVDTVAVGASLFDLGFDTIYGFAQGVAGDVLDLGGILETGADLFPLVAAGAAPVANFSGGILRLVGDAIATSTDLESALGVGGTLSPLSLSDGARSIIVLAASQDTGEDQSVFYAQGSSAGIQISQLALLQGNALDIDQWHASNFGLVA